MSGKIFRGKMGKDGLKKGATYKQGEHPYDLKLVNELVGKCEDILLGAYEETVAFIRSAVPKQIEVIEHFDQDAFLDAIVLGWQQNVDYKTLHLVLTHSIKALHSAGIETFNLNLTTVPEQLYVMFGNLKGTDESSIDITCKGNFRQFGSKVEYCNLDLEGCVESFAQGAKFSTLRFTGPPEMPYSAGWGAEDSRYYLPTMDGMPFSVGDECFVYSTDFKPNHLNYSIPLSDRCRFHVEQFDKGVFKRIQRNGFWDNDNHLYVPNGKGGWNERIPDGEGWNDGWKEVPEE